MSGLHSTSVFIIGGLDGPGAAIADMAHDIGFRTVRAYEGIATVEAQMRATPVCFFFFASTQDVSRLEEKVREIRQARSRKLRCSPLIYFCESPSHDIITISLELGFDDIMTMPFTGQRMAARLMRQIDRKITYVESKDYFGPVTGAAGMGRARQITLIRHPEHGVRILTARLTHAA
jgi:DNA-binding response OmpR family regulator